MMRSPFTIEHCPNGTRRLWLLDTYRIHGFLCGLLPLEAEIEKTEGENNDPQTVLAAIENLRANT